MTIHDPMLDHRKEPNGCVGALVGLGVLAACAACCVVVAVVAAALGVHLWRILT